MHRRRFLQIAAASSISLGPNLAHAATPIKAIAFDGFVIFDPKSIAVLAESLFPSKGAELINAWRRSSGASRRRAGRAAGSVFSVGLTAPR